MKVTPKPTPMNTISNTEGRSRVDRGHSNEMIGEVHPEQNTLNLNKENNGVQKEVSDSDGQNRSPKQLKDIQEVGDLDSSTHLNITKKNERKSFQKQEEPRKKTGKNDLEIPRKSDLHLSNRYGINNEESLSQINENPSHRSSKEIRTNIIPNTSKDEIVEKPEQKQ